MKTYFTSTEQSLKDFINIFISNEDPLFEYKMKNIIASRIEEHHTDVMIRNEMCVNPSLSSLLLFLQFSPVEIVRLVNCIWCELVLFSF